jgi:hypothetical protein
MMRKYGIESEASHRHMAQLSTTVEDSNGNLNACKMSDNDDKKAMEKCMMETLIR